MNGTTGTPKYSKLLAAKGKTDFGPAGPRQHAGYPATRQLDTASRFSISLIFTFKPDGVKGFG
ncbi:MAG TPA: hypothetical protein VJX67_18185, partial [Blastocatellia bacterium]|nr:hypothetical protein [Blastocatellia bacterium]